MNDKIEARNFVDGEYVDALSGERSDLVDPSTGEVQLDPKSTLRPLPDESPSRRGPAPRP